MFSSTMRPANLIRLILLGFLVLILVTLALLLQGSPTVPPAQRLSAAEISRIEQLLVDSAPGDVYNSELRSLVLSSDELNLLLRYASDLMETEPELGSRVTVPGDSLVAEVSLPVSVALVPLFLNLSAQFISDSEHLQLTSLSMGHLRIPGKLVYGLADLIERHYLDKDATYREVLSLMDNVQHLQIANNRLELDLQWEPGLLGRVRAGAQSLLVSDADQVRIAGYYTLLADVISEIPTTTRAVSLSSLLAPLFTAAWQESQRGSDPTAENRAALITLATYVNQEQIAQWLDPEQVRLLPTPRLIEVRIQRRLDLAQHVISSAAISASAGIGVAQILSSVKENYDARYRSGFSFSDLTANRAGMKLGTLATHSPVSAVEIQRRLASIASDTDYLPLLDGSHDGITESDFTTHYRNENSSDYQARLLEIDRLIAGLPLFSGLTDH